jgi:hypothetical protein
MRFSGESAAFPHPHAESFDLSAYKGRSVWLRF